MRDDGAKSLAGCLNHESHAGRSLDMIGIVTARSKSAVALSESTEA
jgi:hypothetical protein